MKYIFFWLIALYALIGIVGCQPATSVNFAERRSELITILPAALPVQAVSDEQAAELDNVVPLSMSLQAQAGKVMVLSYHDVLKSETSDSVESDISVEAFSEQMRSLYNSGCNVISSDELYRHLAFGAKVPPRSVCITFDDNYQGVRDYAAPILKSYGYTFSVYVHTDFVGNKKVGRPKMTWETLKELVRDFDVTVGSHTVTHPDDIRLLTPAEIRRELLKSKQDLEENLGIRVDFLAWPHGRSDAFSVQIARQAGYKMAFGTEIGEAEASASLLQVNRFPFGRFERGLEILLEANRNGMLLAEKVLDSPYKDDIVEQLAGNEVAKIHFGGSAQEQLERVYQTIANMQVSPDSNRVNLAKTQPTDQMVKSVAIEANLKTLQISKKLPAYEQYRCPIILARDKFALMMPRLHHTFAKEYEFMKSVPAGSIVLRGEHWLVRTGYGVVLSPTGDNFAPRSQYVVGWREDGSLFTAETNQLVSITVLEDLAMRYGCVEAMTLGPSILTSPFSN